MNGNPVDLATKYPFIRRMMTPISVGDRIVYVYPDILLKYDREFWSPILYPERHGFDRTEKIEYFFDDDETELGVHNALRILHNGREESDIPVDASTAISLLKWFYKKQNIRVVAGCLSDVYTHPQAHNIILESSYDDLNNKFYRGMSFSIFRGLNENIITNEEHKAVTSLIIDKMLDPAIIDHMREHVRDKEFVDYLEKECTCYTPIIPRGILYKMRMSRKGVYVMAHRDMKNPESDASKDHNAIMIFGGCDKDTISKRFPDPTYLQDLFYFTKKNHKILLPYIDRDATIKRIKELNRNPVHDVVALHHLGEDVSPYVERLHEIYRHHNMGSKFNHAIYLLE